MTEEDYTITCVKTVFNLQTNDYIYHCNPTGKYRIYESGEMTIEFEIKYERKAWIGTVLLTKKQFINEAFISFPLVYKEFTSNAD